MGHRSKLFLGFSSVLALAVAVVMFAPQAYSAQPPTTAVAIRLILAIAGGLTLCIVLYCHFRPDRAPDLLRQITANPLERTGVCFWPTFDLIDDACWLSVYFQNRYAGRSLARIRLLSRAAGIADQTFESLVEPGEFGAIRRQIAIPPGMQGQEIHFEVLAANVYPEGRGRMLRFRDGSPVGNLDEAARTRLTLLLALTGSVFITMPAKIKLTAPRIPPHKAEDGDTERIDSYWRLEA